MGLPLVLEQTLFQTYTKDGKFNMFGSKLNSSYILSHISLYSNADNSIQLSICIATFTMLLLGVIISFLVNKPAPLAIHVAQNQRYTTENENGSGRQSFLMLAKKVFELWCFEPIR